MVPNWLYIVQNTCPVLVSDISNLSEKLLITLTGFLIIHTKALSGNGAISDGGAICRAAVYEKQKICKEIKSICPMLL